MAVDAIDYSKSGDECHIKYELVKNEAVKLIDCPYFTINAIGVDGELEREVISHDSFVLYSCTEGEVDIIMGDNVEHLTKTDVVMIPAEADSVTIKGCGQLMETYISK